MLWSSPAPAHQPFPGTVEQAVRSWNLDPLVLTGLLATAALYGLGVLRARGAGSRRNSRRNRGLAARFGAAGLGRAAVFTAGLGAIVVALVSPLDGLSALLFSAHMAQHLLLTVVAPPLLVLARPGLPLLLGLTPRLRQGLSRASYRYLRPLAGSPAWLAGVVLLQAAVMWFWHVPSMYEAALANSWIHGLEHVTMFAGALLVWMVILNPRLHATAIAALFFTALQGLALGALLTFAPRIIYPSYQTGAWGLTALEHQQLGGLLMWVPTGVIYAAAGIWLLTSWLRSSERPPAATAPARCTD